MSHDPIELPLNFQYTLYYSAPLLMSLSVTLRPAVMCPAMEVIWANSDVVTADSEPEPSHQPATWTLSTLRWTDYCAT
jgi:hypothetical protein